MLHRLFDPGSDRAVDKWKNDYQIEGCEDLQFHHLYRAMAWLGEELTRTEQADKTPFAPRCIKDLVEERLFAYRRDLFTELQLVFFDTTSIYFEGQGGETIGQRGHSKDHRPDLKQMIGHRPNRRYLWVDTLRLRWRGLRRGHSGFGSRWSGQLCRQ